MKSTRAVTKSNVHSTGGASVAKTARTSDKAATTNATANRRLLRPGREAPEKSLPGKASFTTVTTGGIAAGGKLRAWRGGGSGSGVVLIFGTLRPDIRRQQLFNCFDQVGRDLPPLPKFQDYGETSRIAPRLARTGLCKGSPRRGASPTNESRKPLR
jgi:hypothetical protein